MDDIGSDSDATMADSAIEDNEEEEGEKSVDEDEVIEYNSAQLLQKKQKLLSEKFEKSTISAPAKNVCELQEQFLMLEENLHCLSRITREERKQLSDELESVSVNDSDAVSFQQRLLLLSNKQKALLKCFEEQKRLGAQLKLISGQSRYCTRSKGLLDSSGLVKEETTGHMTKSLSQPVNTQLSSSSQLIKSGIQLLSQPTPPSITKHRHQVMGVVKQQQQSVDAAKQQQKKLMAEAKQRQSVGVVKQQEQQGAIQPLDVGKTPQQQPVGVAKQQHQQPVSVIKPQQKQGSVTKDLTGIIQEQAQKQLQFLGVAEQQVLQKSPEATLPSLGYQQRAVDMQQSGDVAKQKENVVIVQSVGVTAQPGGTTQQLSAFILAQQPRVGVAKKQQKPVGVAKKQPVGMPQQLSQNQPVSQCAAQPMVEAKQLAVGGAPRLLQSELAQPVPLDVLINHNLIIAQDQLTCTLLGCQFIGSVTDDGSVISQDGQRFSQLPQWVNSCWATLGHNKRVDRKTAYTKVMYNGTPLLHYCLLYSQQKVSNYLNQSHYTVAVNTTTKSYQTQPEGSLDMKHDKWRVCLISDNEMVPSDDWLPRGFWDSDMILVNHEIERDLIF